MTMNKYDAKIIETTPADATIYELMQHTIRGPFSTFIDIMFNNLLFIADRVKTDGAYYLVLHNAMAELICVKHDLSISHHDVTKVVQSTSNRKSFELDGKRYKMYRKVKLDKKQS